MITDDAVSERIVELKKEIDKLEWHISRMRKKGVQSSKEQLLKDYRKELSELYKRRMKYTFDG